MARYDDLKTGTIAYATFISAVLLLVIVLLLQALTFSWIEGEEVRKLTEGHYTAADEKITRQKAQLDQYAEVEVEIPPPPTTEPAAPGAEKVAPTMEKRLHIPVSQAQSLLKDELAKSEASPKT